MRVLLITRFFSGLHESILEGRWEPRGAPAIYKVIDALRDNGHDLHLVLTARGVGRSDITSDRVIPIDGFENPITILAGEHSFPGRIDKKRTLLSEARHAYIGLKTARGLRPDLIYCDRSNVTAARICARSGRWPVFLRVLGVTPDMWRALDSDRPYDVFLRNNYKGRFAHVLCTDEGSGGRDWLAKALRAETPRSIWLNGVDDPSGSRLHPSVAGAVGDRVLVLFLGRLETLKRADEFVEAFLRLTPEVKKRAVAVVVGGGDRKEALVERVTKEGDADSFIFAGEVSHEQVDGFHQAADIYVSLNRMGNLSNANLEALRAGSCVVLPKPLAGSPVDRSTMRLLGDSVEWVDQGPDLVQNLTEAITRLSVDAVTRHQKAAAARTMASTVFEPWNERIEREVRLLESISEEWKNRRQHV